MKKNGIRYLQYMCLYLNRNAFSEKKNNHKGERGLGNLDFSAMSQKMNFSRVLFAK